MIEKPRLLSTRILRSENQQRINNAGWDLIQHNFIGKELTDPSTIDPNEIQENVIITSKTGVRAFLIIIQFYVLNRNNYNIICVDQATLRSVEEAQLNIMLSGKDAADLATKIINYDSINAVTHICSSRRRDTLSKKMIEAGIFINDIVAYNTILTPTKINHNVDAIMFFSPSGIDSFLKLNDVKEVICACIGDTTATHARKSGFAHVVIPDLHKEEDLVNAVINKTTKIK